MTWSCLWHCFPNSLNQRQDYPIADLKNSTKQSLFAQLPARRVRRTRFFQGVFQCF